MFYYYLLKALGQLHKIDGQWCKVKIPKSQGGSSSGASSEDCTIFVARLSQVIMEPDLKEHFGQFGKIAEIYYPREPFRSYAFVSFVESKWVHAHLLF